MRTVAAVVALLLLPAAAFAQPQRGPAGALGPVSPIAEPDMLEEIEASLKRKDRSGELKRLEEEAIARARRTLEQPRGRELPLAMRRRSWTYDPSIVATEDVRTPDGVVVVKAGTRANPLDYVPFAQKWVFFDAADPRQVRFARSIDMNEPLGMSVKAIVVRGRWGEVMREWKKPVFFDQGGVLVDRFGIQALPALLRRDGAVLRIDEIVLEER